MCCQFGAQRSALATVAASYAGFLVPASASAPAALCCCCTFCSDRAAFRYCTSNCPLKCATITSSQSRQRAASKPKIKAVKEESQKQLKKNLILFAVAAAAATATGSISNRLRCRVALTLNFCKFIRALYDPPLWLGALLPTLRSFVAVTFGNFHYFMSSSLSSSPSASPSPSAPSSSAHHRRQLRRRSQSKFYTPLFAAKQKLNKI